MPISHTLNRWIAIDGEDNQDKKEGWPVPTSIKEPELGASTWEMRTAKAIVCYLGLLSNWLNWSAVQRSIPENESVEYAVITVWCSASKSKQTEWVCQLIWGLNSTN